MIDVSTLRVRTTLETASCHDNAQLRCTLFQERTDNEMEKSIRNNIWLWSAVFLLIPTTTSTSARMTVIFQTLSTIEIDSKSWSVINVLLPCQNSKRASSHILNHLTKFLRACYRAARAKTPKSKVVSQMGKDTRWLSEKMNIQCATFQRNYVSTESIPWGTRRFNVTLSVLEIDPHVIGTKVSSSSESSWDIHQR